MSIIFIPQPIAFESIFPVESNVNSEIVCIHETGHTYLITQPPITSTPFSKKPEKINSAPMIKKIMENGEMIEKIEESYSEYHGARIAIHVISEF